jgi:excisionase family DNA binding protein
MANLNFTFPIDQLASAIVEKMKIYFPTESKESFKEDIYLTRIEVCNILNFTFPTLNKYTKKGILISYRIGARVLYKKSEVEKAVNLIDYNSL